jgi:transporter family-2 protein
VQTFFLYVLALGAGVSVATQQVLNGSLRTSLASPAWAGLVSYAGGLLTIHDRRRHRHGRTGALLENDG